MRNVVFLFIFAISCITSASADVDKDGYNEFTIRPTDIPSDGPRFENFPASIYAGSNTPLQINNNPSAKLFKAQLSFWAKSKPNFAGSYIIASWGCGTDCTSIAVIDAKTGKIYFPDGMTTNVSVNVHSQLLDENGVWHQGGSIKFQVDSRLFILIGMPEERAEDRGISYYAWEDNKFKRVLHVHKNWHPNKR